MIRRLLRRRPAPPAQDRPVLLQLHDTFGDHTVSRAWVIDLADADHVAALLGEPAASWIAPADASYAAHAALAAHPGVVITGGRP